MRKIQVLQELARHVGQSDRRKFFLAAKCGEIVARNLCDYRRNTAAHAEARLARRVPVKGCVVFVARRKKSGSLGLAHPCADCLRVLRRRGAAKVIYSIDSQSYGTITL